MRAFMPAAICAFSAMPWFWVTVTTGMVMLGLRPRKYTSWLPPWLLARITPVAPAACAFSILVTAAHWLRSMNAMFPATCAALVSGEQASVVRPPLASAGSSASTTLPVMSDSRAEACSWPVGYTPATAAGEFTCSSESS